MFLSIFEDMTEIRLSSIDPDCDLFNLLVNGEQPKVVTANLHNTVEKKTIISATPLTFAWQAQTQGTLHSSSLQFQLPPQQQFQLPTHQCHAQKF